MKALERDPKRTVTIKSGPKGSVTNIHSLSDARDPNRGTDSTILFNPNDTGKLGDGVARVPEAQLVHEASHAARGATGTFGKTLRAEEGNATSVENEHRAIMALEDPSVEQRKWYTFFEESGFRIQQRGVRSPKTSVECIPEGLKAEAAGYKRNLRGDFVAP